MTNPIVKAIKTQKMKNTPFITVVIPTRNLEWLRLVNCLKSIQLQNRLKRSKIIEIVIADYGSTENSFQDLMETINPFECTVYRCPPNHASIWSLSVARNIGIRRAKAKYVVTLDADLILEPNVMRSIMALHGKHQKALVVSRVRNLGPMNLNDIKLPQDYNRLRKQCSTPRPGIGGLMSATRNWWHKVRGFDERMKGWGAEDDDIRKRTKLNGRTVINLQSLKHPKTMVFHQWHPKPWLVESGQMSKEELRKHAKANVILYKRAYLVSVLRNKGDWGLWS